MEKFKTLFLRESPTLSTNPPTSVQFVHDPPLYPNLKQKKKHAPPPPHITLFIGEQVFFHSNSDKNQA